MGNLSSGCGCGNGRSSCGSDCCSIIWIILLLSIFCGNGTGLFGGNGCGCNDGCGDNSCIWIILLLLFCGNGLGLTNNNGCGCGSWNTGCGNGCGDGCGC